MDPVTALGVASAAIQFLDFGLEALSLCRQIRDDLEGSTKANKELEAYSAHLEELSKELTAGTRIHNAAGRRILHIAKQCLGLANELQSLLQKVRAAGGAKLTNAVKTTFKSMKERKTIEKLQNALAERRKLLDTALIQDIRDRVDLAAIEQSSGFATLDQKVQDLVLELRTQQTALSDHAQRTQQDLSNIRTQIQVASEASATAHDGTKRKLEALNSGLHDEFSRLHVKNAKDELLTSLFYPEHAARRETVRPPAQKTFEWIFEHEHSQASWTNFADWLASNEQVYWITGKAGSGKSTIMSHIVHDKRTVGGLQQWASTRPLYTASFFFWRPGSILQKSIKGLLRSLLYQLLDEVPGLAERLLKEQPLPTGRIAQWTELRLSNAMTKALQLADSCNICIFIDGLDEFEGDLEALLDVVLALHRLPNIKLCLSSRPEVVLETRLSAFAYLRMEQLNLKDIDEFVQHKLDGFEGARTLIDQITWRADGVFLWAALVTQSIVHGIQAGDGIDMLTMRLNEIPGDVDKMFAHMLSGIDRVHRKSLGTFFRMMSMMAIPSIALFAASLPPDRISSYEDFSRHCARIRTQIIAQSRGLLLVNKCDPLDTWTTPQELKKFGFDELNYARDSFHEYDNSMRHSAIDVHQIKAEENNPARHPSRQNEIWINTKLAESFQNPQSAVHTPSCRERLSGSIFQEVFRSWKLLKVEWVHRSAHDFLLGNDACSDQNVLDLPTPAQVVDQILEGLRRLLAVHVATKRKYLNQSSLEDQVFGIVNFLKRNKSVLGTRLGPILNDIKDMVLTFDDCELFFDERELQSVPLLSALQLQYHEYAVLRKEAFFWYVCSKSGSHEFTEMGIPDLRTRSGHSGLIILILLLCWVAESDPNDYFGNKDSHLEDPHLEDSHFEDSHLEDSHLEDSYLEDYHHVIQSLSGHLAESLNTFFPNSLMDIPHNAKYIEHSAKVLVPRPIIQMFDNILHKAPDYTWSCHEHNEFTHEMQSWIVGKLCSAWLGIVTRRMESGTGIDESTIRWLVTLFESMLKLWRVQIWHMLCSFKLDEDLVVWSVTDSAGYVPLKRVAWRTKVEYDLDMILAESDYFVLKCEKLKDHHVPMLDDHEMASCISCPPDKFISVALRLPKSCMHYFRHCKTDVGGSALLANAEFCQLIIRQVEMNAENSLDSMQQSFLIDHVHTGHKYSLAVQRVLQRIKRMLDEPLLPIQESIISNCVEISLRHGISLKDTVPPTTYENRIWMPAVGS